MAHDRIEGDDVALSHDLIAFMLGVRRAGVGGALSDFEDKGLIATSRKLGKIQSARPGNCTRTSLGVHLSPRTTAGPVIPSRPIIPTSA